MTTNRTFRSMLTRSLIKSAFLFTAIALYAGSSALGGSLRQHDLRMTPDGTPSFADHLASQNDCWSEAGPEGVVPSKAIVELNANEGPKVVDSKIGFAIWMEGAPGTLYYFCR